MSIFDREPVNRKDRRKLAKELQKEQTDFRMSAIGRKIEIKNQARQKAIERLSQQGISPADLKAEYDKGFKAGYDMAAGNSIKMAYAAICLALKKLHGFGKKRCFDVLQEVDHTILYELTSEDLMDKVYDEMGLELTFDDPFDRVQGNEEQA